MQKQSNGLFTLGLNSQTKYSKAESLFENHVKVFRKLAKEDPIALNTLLIAAISGPTTQQHHLAYLLDPVSAERKLTERYRIEFYEMLANWGLEKASEESNSKRKGGKVRGAQLKEQGAKTLTDVLELEASLLANSCPPREINKRIAKQLELEPSYIRRVRNARAQSRKVDMS